MVGSASPPLLSVPCRLVRLLSAQPGVLQLHRDAVRFLPDPPCEAEAASVAEDRSSCVEASSVEAARPRCWPLSLLDDVAQRRHLPPDCRAARRGELQVRVRGL